MHSGGQGRKQTRNLKLPDQARVEHRFHILKRVFSFKVRYRGLAKKHQRLCANFALIDLYPHRRRLALITT